MPISRRPPSPATSAGPRGLSIAAVTAVLKHLLENGLAGRNVTSQLGGDVMISALPPDRIPSGSDERAQLNIFLHQVTPHSALQLGRAGARSPLSVELHYLITAYGAQDFQSEILLGHAIDILHEHAQLDAETVRTSLAALASGADRRVVPPTLVTVATSDVADHVEGMRITPEFLGGEDISRLWSALQARFRPSATYKVTSVPLVAPAEA